MRGGEVEGLDVVTADPFQIFGFIFPGVPINLLLTQTRYLSITLFKNAKGIKKEIRPK